LKILSVIVSVVVLAAVVGAVAVLRNPTPGPKVSVVIASGSTTSQIASTLQKDGVIGNRLVFRILAKLNGLDGKIEAGRYDMFKHMGIRAALDILQKPPIEKGVAITVPPGFTVAQIADRLAAHTKITKAAFLAAAAHTTLPALLMHQGPAPAEGVLYPETYVVNEQETASELIGRMENEFDQQTSSLDWDQATRLRVSPYDVVIIASLIEREAKVPVDRPKVAAVIYNRLKKHMRLQIDATVLYGIPHKVPTLADLKRPSPYNTYLIPGLPPTPIANPGLSAIDAALHPAAIDALYYVVCEPSGQHCFTNSAQEFERLKARRPAETH